MLNFCDFIQVYVFTINHHLKSKLNFPILPFIKLTNFVLSIMISVSH